MRVAAIYDIHGNLSALEAVLNDIRQARRQRRPRTASQGAGPPTARAGSQRLK
jgi:hypothetical protein